MAGGQYSSINQNYLNSVLLLIFFTALRSDFKNTETKYHSTWLTLDSYLNFWNGYYSPIDSQVYYFLWLPNKKIEAPLWLLQCRRPGFHPWVGKIPWRRKWQPTPVILPGKSHGWRSLAGTVHWVAKSQTRLSDFTFTFNKKIGRTFHFESLEVFTPPTD